MSRPQETLQSMSMREADLQAVFDAWFTGRNGWAVAGVPTWLQSFTKQAQQKAGRRLADGYVHIPDLVWESEDGTLFVFELKCAAKNEPLALAEVLHHADILEQEERGRKVVPVIVGQTNRFSRRAITYLRRHGYVGSLRYLEIWPLGNATRKVLWFDEPHAAWSPTAAPIAMLAVASPAPAHWYGITGSDTVVGVDVPTDERPLFSEHRALWASPLDGEREYLTWDSSRWDDGRAAVRVVSW